MDKGISQCRQNMIYVRNLGGIHAALVSLTTPAVDASDLLRAQYVLGVSALDHYVHELTRVGMISIFSGTRSGLSCLLPFSNLNGFACKFYLCL
jgi:hypothetical protein